LVGISRCGNSVKCPIPAGGTGPKYQTRYVTGALVAPVNEAQDPAGDGAGGAGEVGKPGARAALPAE
jgi:hypothetical protein